MVTNPGFHAGSARLVPHIGAQVFRTCWGPEQPLRFTADLILVVHLPNLEVDVPLAPKESFRSAWTLGERWNCLVRTTAQNSQGCGCVPGRSVNAQIVVLGPERVSVVTGDYA